MCELCDLVKGEDGFVITMCRTCGMPMVVSKTHKDAFSVEDTTRIRRLFPTSNIRWKQRQILDHAHCHIE